MLLTLLTYLHLMIGLALVLFVLLQDPKGGAMGVFSGGSSSSSFFGASGATNFLTTATRWLAIAFAASCLTLTYMTATSNTSVMGTLPVTAPSPTPAEGQQQLPGEGAAPASDAPKTDATPADAPAAPTKTK